MSVNITALWMHVDFLETPSDSSLLQLLLCADLTESVWCSFTCLQSSCLIMPCQKVNKRWSARWMTSLPTWVFQSRLLTAAVVPLVSLITQNLLFSAAGNGEGLLSNGLFQFVSKCPLPLGCWSVLCWSYWLSEESLWCCHFLLQKFYQRNLCCAVTFLKGCLWWSNFMFP